jgi:hypothetical protein
MRGLSDSAITLIQYAKLLLAADFPMTLRQLHYAIFSKKKIEYGNDQASYKKLSRATTLARRLYRDWELGGEIGLKPQLAIDPEWMIDETRDPEVPSVWDNAAEYIDTLRRDYRRDLWQNQPCHVEVWSEKATILGSLRPVADKWGITTRVSHGFGSTSMEGQIGRLFESLTNKQIHVFYLGDHDPSGHVIEQDIHDRVEKAAGVSFKMRRLAIHADDIQRFRLPPQRIKATDSRAASFRRQFGRNAATVELDALPAAELRRRVERAVKARIDFSQWDRQVEIQEVEFKSIARVAAAFKNLPQAEA